jgi:hypothetical protein
MIHSYQHAVFLSPEMLNPLDFPKGKTEVSSVVVFQGTGKLRVKKKTIMKRIQLFLENVPLFTTSVSALLRAAGIVLEMYNNIQFSFNQLNFELL